jgi:hypothetical protein
MNPELSTDHLRALFRAITAAKFTHTPSDNDLLTSKSLAESSRIISQLILQVDINKWGKIAQENWETWYWLTPERDEWAQALQTGSNLFITKWNKWSQNQRLEIVRLLICPYGMHDEFESVFLSALDTKIALLTNGELNGVK